MRIPLLFLLAGLLLAATPALAQSPCGTFTSTPVPVEAGPWEAEFFDVATLPDGTAWATGQRTLYAPFSSPETFTLAMRWDGHAWEQVPTPSPSPYPGGTYAVLHAVGAVAPDDVWAAGEARGDAGGLSLGPWIMVQHWDGQSWQLVDVPGPPGGVSINFSGTRVYDIAVLAADDIWFGGQWGEPNAQGSVTWRPLAMHWDGSDLTIHDTPAPYEAFYGYHVVSLSAVASDDVWAACARNTAGGHAQRLVALHWDGSTWSEVELPGSGMRVLYTVEAIASDDVWFFGEHQWPAGPQDVFALHWDGSGFTELVGAPPARGAFALGPDALYTGAGYNVGHGISFFDGEQSAVIADFPGLNVHVFEGERGAGCSGWIVGREMVGGKKPFAAKLEANVSGGDGGGSGGRVATGWVDVGGGAVGGKTAPALSGAGSLLPGGAATLSLGPVPPGSLSMLVVGFSELGLPLPGGVLVPSPDLLLPLPPAGPDGVTTLHATWPAGLPSGTRVWLQAWTADPHGPLASSALRTTLR